MQNYLSEYKKLAGSEDPKIIKNLSNVEKQFGTSRLVFRHESPNFYKSLHPESLAQVARTRQNPQYMKDREKTEKKYHDLLPSYPEEKSFLYATIVGYHKMEAPTSYPGYTYYFYLSPQQIGQTIFEVVGQDKSLSMPPDLGQKALAERLKFWDGNSKEFKTYTDPVLKEPIYPRIEVVISFPVEYFSYVLQQEDR